MKSKVKSILSVLLTMCMLVTMIPVNTFASDFGADAFSDGAVIEAVEDNVPEQNNPVEGETNPEQDTTIEGATSEQEAPADGEAVLDGAELDGAVFGTGEEEFGDGEKPELDPFSDGEVEAAAVTMESKPADGTTKGQPFPGGTGGSDYFRIPAMVTLNDGTIVAATDARWNTTGDGGGLDTIVSRSTDGGATWSYTFANYLGDNGNEWNSASTAFIDPALATDGSNVYMVVDLFPAGYALNSANNKPIAGANGFNSDGNLRLSDDGRSSYDFYLKDGRIYGSDGLVNGYLVDEYFNITGPNNVNTNLFCADSPYQVYPTNYLYLTKSSNGGATWSEPTLINVKKPQEQTCLIGPGRGLVTSNGRIVFTCYNYTSGDKNSSVIYSDDQGKTWTRSSDMSDISSEATVVEADGRLYLFARHGGYYVSTDNGATWSSKKSVEVNYDTGCQINAITYSKKIDGKTAILLSAPTNNRTTGKIFVGLVQDDGSINWEYSYSVNGNGKYSYSCMSELKDGSVGLLYESDERNGQETYQKIAISEIASGAQIGDGTDSGTSAGLVEPSTGEVSNTLNVTLTANNTSTVNFSGLGENETLVCISSDENVATATVYESTITVNALNSGTATITITVAQGEVFAAAVDDEYTIQVTVNSSDATETKKDYVNLSVGGKDKRIDTTGNYENYVGEYDSSIVEIEVIGDNGQAGTVDYQPANLTCDQLLNSNTTNWKAASQPVYYQVDNKYYPVYVKRSSSNELFATSYTYTWGYSETDSANDVIEVNTQNFTISWWSGQEYPVPNLSFYTKSGTEAVPASTTITFTGIAEGKTFVVIGNTKYNITVKKAPEILDTTTTPFIAKTGIGVSKKVTKLTTSVGVRFDLDLDANYSGSEVTWTTADESVAIVDQNGVVTGRGTGTTKVTATIDGVAYTIPVTVLAGSGYDGDKLVNIYISEITDTTVYYSENCGTDLTEVRQGEAIYVKYPSDRNVAMDFFGVPNEGYALTRMSATNAAGDYMALNSTIPAKTDFYTKSGAAGANQISAFGAEKVQNMIQAALNKNCDGGLGFTRGAGNTSEVKSDLTFRSEQLPTVEKSVYGILGSSGRQEDFREYTEGMAAKTGETVYFKIDVTTYKALDSITYTNALLTDTMQNNGNVNFVAGAGGESTGSHIREVTKDINNDGLIGQTHSYYVAYKIEKSDLDTEIINTVELSYTYKSKYSSGSFQANAEAKAKITATDFNPQDIVIDFGLPVKIAYKTNTDGISTDDNTLINKEINSGTAQYGNVEVGEDKTSITYTPAEVLKEADTVTLMVKNTSTNNEFKVNFNVYPASNVLYEAEDFMTDSTGKWQPSVGTKTNQSVSSANDIYGYDAAYSESQNIDGMGGSYMMDLPTGKTPTLTTTFKGDAFDLIGECGTMTGTVVLRLKRTDGNPGNIAVIIDTSYNDDTVGTIHQVPLAHVENLDVTTEYTAEVIGYYREVKSVSSASATRSMASGGYDVNLNRIYDDLARDGFDLNEVEYVYFDQNSSLAQMDGAVMAAYAAEGAAANADEVPAVSVDPVSGGKIVIDGFRVYNTATDNTIFVENEKNVKYVNVLDAVLRSDGALDTFAAYVEGDANGEYTRANYESNGGPQNEIYLSKNQAVAFNPSGNVQISLRAVKGSTSYSVNRGTSNKLFSNTEMYYKCSSNNGLVVIENTGESLLAIGNLKLSNGQQMNAMTDSDMQMVFAMLAAPEKPDIPQNFEPEKMMVSVDSLKLIKNKLVTVKVTASQDVEYITVNGHKVNASNKLLVKYGISKYYIFTYQELVGRKDKPVYEVIAYNKNDVPSKSANVKG